jgi:hypothetical protein
MSPDCLAGTRMTLAHRAVVRGSRWLFLGPLEQFQCFSVKEKRTASSKRPLSFAHIMASGDTCPQGTSNARHVATLAGLKTREFD